MLVLDKKCVPVVLNSILNLNFSASVLSSLGSAPSTPSPPTEVELRTSVCQNH